MRTAPDVATAVDWAKAGEPSMVRCPSHDDGHASLSVGPGTRPNDDGVIQPVVFHCHAGCEAVDIIRDAGLSWAEVCEPLDEQRLDRGEWTPRGTASHVYGYTDEHGELLFQALRVPVPGGKEFSQRQWNSVERKWVWNLQGVRRVLYMLPEVVAAVADGMEVWILEGEKDVHRARSDGKVATCSPMGAGKWSTEYGRSLTGARVTIVADADEPGRKHALEVYEDLVTNHDCEVRIVETPMANCKDYTDHRQHGGTDEMLVMTRCSYPTGESIGGYGIQTFLETDFPEGAEIIPGTLAEANVVVLVGPEGHGKSLFLRQFAVCASAGLHPFTGARIDPLRVMYIDAENPEFQQKEDWSRLVGLAARHTGESIPDERLWLMSEWRHEPDLITPDGQAWLFEKVATYRPQLLIMGPVQNLVGRDVKDDEVVRRFKKAINGARAICGTAFMIEHHAPHRSPGDKERQMRPYGSSLFMKWPDYGYGLKPTEDEGTYDMYPFRRPRVRRRAWPEQFRWGRPNTMEFPWEVAEPTDGGTVVQGHFG